MRQPTPKKAKKPLKFSTLAWALAVVAVLAAAGAVAFTPVLGWLGIASREPSAAEKEGALQRQGFDLDSALEEQRAKDREKAEQQALRKAMEEADMQRSHQEDAFRNLAEEQSFREWYKPAAECKNTGGNWKVTVKCGNDFLYARRYFIEHFRKPD
jgi:hypothetical protein